MQWAVIRHPNGDTAVRLALVVDVIEPEIITRADPSR